MLGTILKCKSTGIDLSSFNIDENDHETFHHIFEGDDNFEFINRNFRPKARIVNLLLQHTLTPRSGSFNNPTSKVCKALFAIFGNYDINWAQVILDELHPKILEWVKTLCIMESISLGFLIILEWISKEKNLFQEKFLITQTFLL